MALGSPQQGCMADIRMCRARTAQGRKRRFQLGRGDKQRPGPPSGRKHEQPLLVLCGCLCRGRGGAEMVRQPRCTMQVMAGGSDCPVVSLGVRAARVHLFAGAAGREAWCCYGCAFPAPRQLVSEVVSGRCDLTIALPSQCLQLAPRGDGAWAQPQVRSAIWTAGTHGTVALPDGPAQISGGTSSSHSLVNESTGTRAGEGRQSMREAEERMGY